MADTATAKRAAIYARVSSELQRKNNSIEIQLRTCREYATRQGFTIDPAHEFVDVFTGTTLERPSFDAAKSVVGKVDAVIFHVQDRFGRADVLDTVQQIRWFEQHGTSVHITNRGQIDTTDDIGLIMLILEVQAAKKEREDIVRRTSGGKRERAVKGKVCIGQTPKYGYDYDTKTGTLRINEEEAKWVKQIFEWHAVNKLGNHIICNKLSDLAVPTKFDNLGITKKTQPHARWNDGSIGHIMTDEIYTGVWYYKTASGERIPVEVPAIISRELFELAQRVSHDHQQFNKGPLKYFSLMYGLMICAQCGRPFHPERPKGRPARYHCYGQKSSYSTDGKSHVCSGGFDLSMVDNAVWKAIADMLRNPEELIAGFRQRQADKQAALQPDREYLARLKAELEKLDRQKARLLPLYTNSDWTREELNIQKALIDRDRNMRINKIAELEERLSETAVDERQIEAFEQFCEKINEGLDLVSDEEKRKIIELLNIKAIVHRAPSIRKNGCKGTRGSGTITLTGLIQTTVALEPNSEDVNLNQSSKSLIKVRSIPFSLIVKAEELAA